VCLPALSRSFPREEQAVCPQFLLLSAACLIFWQSSFILGSLLHHEVVNSGTWKLVFFLSRWIKKLSFFSARCVLVVFS
jgi:hypothetical protein